MTGSSQHVPWLPPRSGIAFPPSLATRQWLQPFPNFAEVHWHQETVAKSLSDTPGIAFSLSLLPPHAKPGLFKEQDAVAWVTVSTSQPMVGSPAGFTGFTWGFWQGFPAATVGHTLFLKRLPVLGHAPPLALALCPFSLFLLSLLPRKCRCSLVMRFWSSLAVPQTRPEILHSCSCPFRCHP